MRRILAWGVVAMVAIGVEPTTTDAGKRKKRGPEKFSLVARDDAHETRNGVEVRLDERGHGWRADGNSVATWVLVAQYDGEVHEAYFTSEEPWAELSAFGAVYQAVPDDEAGVRVTVLPDMPVPLSSDALDLLVTAEANRRGVAHDGQSGTMITAGVARVSLGGGGFWAVDARIGSYSGEILSFDVDPYATITPTRPRGAVTVKLPSDGTEVEAGGVRLSLASGIVDVVKGKRRVAATTMWTSTSVIEASVLSRVLWIIGDEVVVIPKKRVKMSKKPISTAKAIKLVEAEADKRDIAYDGSSAIASRSDGVITVKLTLASEVIVTAAVGAKSKKLIRYAVQPPSFVKPRPQEPEPEPEVEPEMDPMAPVFTATMQKMLDEHNRHRANHCAPALAWSDELAMVAQTWAERLRDMSCAFEHSSGDYGENLAAGTPGTMSPEAVVGMWYEEVDDYDFTKPRFSARTGHFTQVVWKKTKKVGCGMVPDCNGMDIWVCNYFPAGNFTDEFEKNVAPKKTRATSCQ